MKLWNKRHTLILALLTAFTLSLENAWAGTEVGNGGFAVVVDGKLYLQDFFESGLHKNPVLSSRRPQKTYFQDLVQNSFGHMEGISQEVLDGVVVKLEDIEKIDPIFAYILALGIGKYTWRMVTFSWQDTHDNGGVLDGSNIEFRPVALRQEKIIRIGVQNWQQLDAANQVGLIFHEMLYALVITRSVVTMTSYSALARALNGYLFSQDLERRSLRGLESAIGSDWVMGHGESAQLQGEVIYTDPKLNYAGANVYGGSMTEFEERSWVLGTQIPERTERICSHVLEVGMADVFFRFVRTRYDIQFNQWVAPNAEVYQSLQVNTFRHGKTDTMNRPRDEETCLRLVKPILISGDNFLAAIP